jgi:pteridine reductase
MASSTPVVLITGAAHRLGAHTARHLHQRGWNLVIHYRSREADANALRDELNNIRQESAVAIQADLAAPDQTELLARKAISTWGRLDGLVNNASVFYPNPTQDASAGDWDAIMNTNLRAPFFLGQACLSAFSARPASLP